MANSRLSSLAILSIENERSRLINLDELAEEFVRAKQRRGLADW